MGGMAPQQMRRGSGKGEQALKGWLSGNMPPLQAQPGEGRWGGALSPGDPLYCQLFAAIQAPI